MSAGWGVRGRRRERLRAALGLAADFRTWQLLARGQGLTRREVTALMTGLATGLAGRTRDDLSEER